GGFYESRRARPAGERRPSAGPGSREALDASDHGDVRREHSARRPGLLSALSRQQGRVGTAREDALEESPHSQGLLLLADRETGFRDRLPDRPDVELRARPGDRMAARARGKRSAGHGPGPRGKGRARDPGPRSPSRAPARGFLDRPARSD